MVQVHRVIKAQREIQDLRANQVFKDCEEWPVDPVPKASQGHQENVGQLVLMERSENQEHKDYKVFQAQ